MRGLYPNSTDLAYSPFDKADLLEVARALGTSNINVITTATLSPERTLFHSCLNGVQSYVRLNTFGETERGAEIAELSQQIYDALKDDFQDTLAQSQDDIAKKTCELHDFINAMDASQTGQPWDEATFLTQYPPKAQQYRWQSKAIETYRTVQNNIASGDYAPTNGWDAKRVTAYWGERNLEYKHYRWLARQCVEAYIEGHFADRLLTKHPSDKRRMGYIFGPMGAGKSDMTAEYLWQLPESERDDIILHDADYLKPALAQSAIKDGVLTESTGAEVQNESSIALYEGTRKRHYLAARRQAAPDVLLNSLTANPLELEEGLVGGGSIEAKLISMSPQDAWQSVCKRGETLKRMPAQEDVEWSTRASVDSLMRIVALGNTPVKTAIYERTYGQPPEQIATLDNQSMTLEATDAKRLADVLGRSSGGLAPFVKDMQSQGVTFQFKSKTDEKPFATLSADGIWEQTTATDFSDGTGVFKALAEKQRIGGREMPISKRAR